MTPARHTTRTGARPSHRPASGQGAPAPDPRRPIWNIAMHACARARSDDGPPGADGPWPGQTRRGRTTGCAYERSPRRGGIFLRSLQPGHLTLRSGFAHRGPPHRVEHIIYPMSSLNDQFRKDAPLGSSESDASSASVDACADRHGSVFVVRILLLRYLFAATPPALLLASSLRTPFKGSRGCSETGGGGKSAQPCGFGQRVMASMGAGGLRPLLFSYLMFKFVHQLIIGSSAIGAGSESS